MTDTSTSLGPLGLEDGRWVVGDVRRPGGTWVEFRADGLFQHAGDSEGLLISWRRIMLGMRITLGSKYPAKGFLGGMPGTWKRRGPGYLHMTLRHPYEDWSARFDRHPRAYPGYQMILLTELLRQAVEAGEAERLGDPEWLGTVVGRLAPQRPWTTRATREAVRAAREAGTAARRTGP